MSHPIYRVVSFEVAGPYTLEITFNDDTSQTINFRSVLEGEVFSPLTNLSLFNQVQIDPEIHTLVWPNGADFDPATLHDWPEYEEELKSMAQTWAMVLAKGR